MRNRNLGRVVDVGCGPGFTALLLKLYLNVDYLLGLDVSVHKILLAKKLNLYDDLVVADAGHPPLRSSMFDTLISIEVLHVLSAEALSHLEETIKKDGSIVLTLPSLPGGLDIEGLICKGYDVYRYFLRGFILVDLRRHRILLAYDTVLFQMLKVAMRTLNLMHRFVNFPSRGYLLVLR